MIFDFQDYRLFLRNYKESLPKKGWGFVSQLAESIGLSQGQVSLVLTGEKDFSVEQGVLTAEFLKLNDLETEYFIWLVLKSRSGHHKLKSIAQTKIGQIKKQGQLVGSHLPPDQKLTEEQKTIFYSHYLYSAIRLFTSIGRGATLEEVYAKFSISRIRALAILEFLVQTGLCIKEKDFYKIGTQRTFIERGSPHQLQHHANWRLKSVSAADEIQDNELMYTSPVSMSRQDFEIVRAQLLVTIKDISQRVRDSDSELVVCWNFDWFEVRK